MPMLEYKHIDWLNPKTPKEVADHPLWEFQLALSQTHSNATNHKLQQYWALASIKSLIEIDLNRAFVIEAGLAYERDVDKGIYVETPPDSGIYKKQPGVKSEFEAYRIATGNAVHGDDAKADTLRTSPMMVSPEIVERISYHPSISYPTGDIKNNEEQRRASKNQQMDYFYMGLGNIWRRIKALPSQADRQRCLLVFCAHIKIKGIGCANERLAASMDATIEELIKHEGKKVSEKQLLKAIEPLISALSDGSDPAKLFGQLFNDNVGYTLEDSSLTINESTKKEFAQKIIELGIQVIGILDEEEKENYLAKMLGASKEHDEIPVGKKEEKKPLDLDEKKEPGENYAVGVEENNGSYTIHARNKQGAPRFIIIDKAGKATGFKGEKLGYVEQLLSAQRKEILTYFGFPIPHSWNEKSASAEKSAAVDKKVQEKLFPLDGENSAVGVEGYNGGYKLHAQNKHGAPRFIIIDKAGKATGYNGENLGYVEQLLSAQRKEILMHFGMPVPDSWNAKKAAEPEILKKQSEEVEKKQQLQVEKKKGQEQLEKDLEGYKIAISTLLVQLKTTSEELNQKAQSKEQYLEIAQTVAQLHTTLQGELNNFFTQPTATKFQQSHDLCETAIIEAVKKAEQHRGWHKVDPILRGILGVLAALTVLPALIVQLSTKQGFTQTFFTTPATKTAEKMHTLQDSFNSNKKAFEDKGNKLSEEDDLEHGLLI